MLEIPEAKVLAEQLNQTIEGKLIDQVMVLTSPHRFTFFGEDKDSYESYIKGKKIGKATNYGGQVEIAIENYRLLFGDGTNLRFYEAHEPKPDKHQFYLGFSDGTALAVTVAMYGFIRVFKEGTNDNPFYLVAKEKVSPLTAEFDLTYFKALVSQAKLDKPSLSLKGLLATEQRIPGLGNGCSHDILFTAKQHPKSKLSKLTDSEIADLFMATKTVLKKMSVEGGRDIEKDLFGNNGAYRCLLSSKTFKEPCPVCQGKISRQAFLGGNIYFCPNCQKEKL